MVVDFFFHIGYFFIGPVPFINFGKALYSFYHDPAIPRSGEDTDVAIFREFTIKSPKVISIKFLFRWGRYAMNSIKSWVNLLDKSFDSAILTSCIYPFKD